MKRILKLLARLYPAAWRSRYGVEYEALLEEKTPRVRDIFDVAGAAIKMHLASRSFVRIVLPCALAGTVAALALSFTKPARYSSHTAITVTTFPSPGPLSSPSSSPDLNFPKVLQNAVTDQVLAGIIQESKLYPAERTRMPLNDVILEMKKNIEVRPLASEGAGVHGFDIQFQYTDPTIAKRVDAELVGTIVMYNLQRSENSSAVDHGVRATFRVTNPPNLPQRPDGPSRIQFSTMGLLAGLTGGLGAAAVLSRRRRSTAASA